MTWSQKNVHLPVESQLETLDKGVKYVQIFNFEHISLLFQVILLLSLKRQMFLVISQKCETFIKSSAKPNREPLFFHVKTLF